MVKYYKLYIDRISSMSFDCFEQSDSDNLIDSIVKGLTAYALKEDVEFVDFDAIKRELEETGQIEFGAFRARIIEMEED